MSATAWQALLDSLPPYRRKLERRVLDALAAHFGRWCANRPLLAALPASSQNQAPITVCDFLADSIAADSQQIETTRFQQGQFLRKINKAGSAEERHALLLDQSRMLGANPTQLSGDQAALQRWFGADALADRLHARVAALERQIAVALYLLAQQAQAILQNASEDQQAALWARLRVEASARSLFAFEGHPRVKLAAFSSLATALLGLPPPKREGAVEASTLQFIYRCALDAHQPVWLQVEAIELLWALAPDSFLEIARLRLTRRSGGDDFFVRRRALLEVARALVSRPQAAELLTLALQDESPYVRQGLALALAEAPSASVADCLPALLADPAPQVRGQALLALADQFAQNQRLPLLDWLTGQLATETDAFVLRTALFVTNGLLAGLEPDQPPDGLALLRLQQAIRQLHQTAADLKVRRWTAQTLSHFTLQADPALQTLVRDLGQAVAACAPGQHRCLPRAFDGVSAEQLGRAALFLVEADHPLDFERRFGHWRVHRGHRFGFRLWRWLHEFRHPSPDKRQAFRHTIGRIFRGHVRVPSPILAELAATKVPGEPLHLASEGGWRPYLPLPDELMSSLDLPRSRHPLRIFTSEGVTEVSPPASLLRRLPMRARLCWRFADLAQARNWQEGAQQTPDHYVRLLQQSGFSVRFVPHPGTPADPAVSRFFPAGLVFGLQGEELGQQFQDYFFSVYGNTLFQLTVLVSAAVVAFVIRHGVSNLSVQRARNDIPLVVGGWGTRGKSGTERLKAGLFNGLGYSVVSKTTGCEAMFLHSHPYQALREMFLFRPYDKATIWEQHDVTRIASALKADVMLWECMALTPAFVELLQKRWMRDDLSTITNTFPDHEDVQGPAGINIPEVMTHFIPRQSLLLTSEEQMRPILSTAAARLGTVIKGVGWLEAGLLTPDILSRFPYQEHPDNIALVVRMAAELGIAEDFALKEMADRVVPDLGVLKVYPEATIAGRRLSFANGMSANERFGCLGNWYRLGFDKIDMERQPDTLVSTVVNNRADRIARSRVFASILVNDLSADLHFLIGSNLEGLMGYIKEAWASHAAALSLWPDSGESPLAVFESQARRLRVPYTVERQSARLAAMLGPSDQVAAFADQDSSARQEYEAFAARLATVGAKPDPQLDNDFRQQLWHWFERKLVLVSDYYASGNQIVQLIAEHTPPGFHNRVMGIQNIKGTGLDFVYRWQAWALCHAACADLRAGDGASYRRGMTALSTFQEYGVLCEAHVRDTLQLARQSPHGHLAMMQSQLSQIDNNLEQAMAAVRSQLGASREQSRFERLVLVLEGLVDAGDAIRRRKLANQIYRDLIAQRISHARAAIELLKLTQQQKGGWLYAQIRDRVWYLADALQRARQRLLHTLHQLKPVTPVTPGLRRP